MWTGVRKQAISAGVLALACASACARSDNAGVDAGANDATASDTTISNDAHGTDAAADGAAGGDADAGAVGDGGAETDACPAGLGDCDENPTTGCETNTTNDVDNCGACGRACSSANVAAAICAGGVCTSTCVVGAGNCTQPVAPLPDDGCETATATNSLDCSGCGNSCANAMFAANPTCSQGAGTQRFCGCTTALECEFGPNTAPTCNAGLCLCNNTTCQSGEACAHPGDGGASDGGAGDVCTCYGGAACAAGQSCCQAPLGCVNLFTDPQNCGGCGRTCPPGFVCTAGMCTCGTAASCNGGAMPGTFVCTESVCSCADTICEGGQRCLPDGGCG